MTARHWIFAVTLDALFAALLYAWLAMDHEAAGSFFIGAMWAIGVIGLIALFGDKPKPHSLAFTIYHAATEVVLIAAIVYVGHVWLAALHMMVWIFMEARRMVVAEPAGGAK